MTNGIKDSELADSTQDAIGAEPNSTGSNGSESGLIGRDPAHPQHDSSLILDEPQEYFEHEEPARGFGWVVPAAAVIAIAGWSAFFVWTNWFRMITGGTAQQWTGWITAWSVPVLLVVALWLLAMRNSSKEAQRFGGAARLLAHESAQLEERLTAVNQQLSLAREAMGSQSRDLEFLGRTASERISEHAEKLEALISVNGAQIDAISKASVSAAENMTRLAEDLPDITTSARDANEQISNAGKTAKTQLGELVAGFERLNEFGQASERQVSSLNGSIRSALGSFDTQLTAIEEAAGKRIAEMNSQGDAFRDNLKERETLALAAMRGRSEALQNELAEIEEAERTRREEASDKLEERITMLSQKAEETSAQVREGEEAAITAWGRQLEEMHERLKQIIRDIATIDAKALEAARNKLALLTKDTEVLDRRMAERDGTIQAQMVTQRKALDDNQKKALDQFTQQLSNFDETMEARQAKHSESLAALADQSEAVSERMTEVGSKIEEISASGTAFENSLIESTSSITRRLEESRDGLESTADAVTGLTGSSEQLLELLKASSNEASQVLPDAIAAFGHSLASMNERTASLSTELQTARSTSDGLASALTKASNDSRTAIEGVENLIEKVSGSTREQADALDALQAKLAEIGADKDAMAERAQGELRAAIRELEESGQQAVEAIETQQAARIKALAQKIGDESASAIEDAIQSRTSLSVSDLGLEELELATSKATAAAQAAALSLQDKLGEVDELAANLEARVARAREMAEDQVDDDFARRVALITESLNSNAIDIGKALSTEVTDTAWAAYLRGDRGIFTRRAVHIMDNTMARDIADLFDRDSEFREHVSRYIHDFEGMLRTLLATRDGNAVSVTLLGSDMGKLYVGLAQALERLRQS
jgi:chromosome segregation ATPase